MVSHSDITLIVLSTRSNFHHNSVYNRHNGLSFKFSSLTLAFKLYFYHSFFPGETLIFCAGFQGLQLPCIYENILTKQWLASNLLPSFLPVGMPHPGFDAMLGKIPGMVYHRRPKLASRLMINIGTVYSKW